ncbi:MAG: TIGR04066 family peptide maturation system protein [Firmicutes bacterium]|nr:TIGR04066 family peptide maturation system protein [Bacillota bacterium]
MERKLALFPMTRDQCGMVRYSSLLDGYKLSSLLIPSFLPFNNMDSSRLDGGKLTGMTITHYNADRMDSYDVIYMDYDDKHTLSLYKEVYDAHTRQDKKIILSQALSKAFDICSKKSDDENDMVRERLFDIPVPVITVFAQGYKTDQFATELGIREYFVEKGYQVSQLGSQAASKFFNFSQIPPFLFSDGDAYWKIIRLNHYIKTLVENENPDLLILGAPNMIMKYNIHKLTGLGIIPLIVGDAVKSDISVVTTHHGKYDEKYFNMISSYCRYRLGCPAQFFNIANTKVESDSNDPNKALGYLTMNNDVVLQSIETGMVPDEFHAFSALDSNSINKACNLIESVLAGNVQTLK